MDLPIDHYRQANGYRRAANYELILLLIDSGIFISVHCSNEDQFQEVGSCFHQDQQTVYGGS